MSVNQQDIFWKDGDFGDCVGGFYIKNNLKEFIDKCKETGLNPVGLKVDEDGIVEVIVQRSPEYVALYEKDKK
jgi:hypothetical protein